MRPFPIIVENASMSIPPAEIVASFTVGQHVDFYSAFSPFLPTVRTWGLLDCTSISLLNGDHMPNMATLARGIKEYLIRCSFLHDSNIRPLTLAPLMPRTMGLWSSIWVGIPQRPVL